MLRRCAAQTASTSNGRSRKSAKILVTSKSNGFGRASDIVLGFRLQIIENLCSAQCLYRRQPVSRQENFCGAAKIRQKSDRAGFGALARDGSAPLDWSEPALDTAQPAIQRRH